MTVGITVTKDEVYKIVEGLTVNIGQKNPDVNFETLWASEGDTNSLNLFWDEATRDLENTLQPWVESKSGTQNPYTITVRVADDWPSELDSILIGAAVNYMAHAVLAGWLAITPGLQIGIDYTAVAADDLANIVGMLIRRRPAPTTTGRTADATSQPDESGSIETTGRTADATSQPDESGSIETTGRTADSALVDDDSAVISAGARHNNRDHVPVYIKHETLNMSGVYSKKY